MTMQPPMIVFTDLDGTLLDHDTYSFAPAGPALARLAELGVPVILASSKTAAEIAPLRDALGQTRHPAIVENGAGVLVGGGAPNETADDYAKIRAALESLPAQVRTSYRGFGDMTVAEVAEITGLDPESAALAKSRAHSEPGLWGGSEAALQAFLEALTEHGISARRGGRFLTLSFGATKADRMRQIAARYGDPFSIALGDAPNDLEMLEAADLGIIIANAHNAPLPRLAGEHAGRIRRSTKPGPDGWNTEVLRVLMDRSEV